MGEAGPLCASAFLPKRPSDSSEEAKFWAGASQKGHREGLSAPQEGVGHCPAIRVPLALGDRRSCHPPLLAGGRDTLGLLAGFG